MKNHNTHFTPLADSLDSQEMDRLAQKNFNISAEALMESAGALSAQAILTYLKHPTKLASYRQARSLSVMILCGPGNNGGDGMVVARHLLSNGIGVDLFLPDSKIKKLKSVTKSASLPLPTKKSNLTSIEPTKTQSASNLKLSLYELQKQRLLNQGVRFKFLSNIEDIKKAGSKAQVVVDALFGVGLSKEVQEPYASVIKWLNSAEKFVVSLDTPSGLNVETGHIRGQAVRANLTLSFGLAKPGFYLLEGPAHVGRLKVFSIGFPPSLLFKGKKHFLIKKSWVSANLPKRGLADHKAQHGHLLVLAGSKGFEGAGGLTAEAGYRMGAGYVTLSTGPKGVMKTTLLDVLTQSIEDPNLLKHKTAVAIGPGFGVGKHCKKQLLTLKKTSLPVVVDADAWAVCVKEGLFPLPSHWVCTPHSGELSRLFSKTACKTEGREPLLRGSTFITQGTEHKKANQINIDKDRVFYAMQGSEKAGCLLLLKGFHSVLAQKERCWIIPTGNKALSKAGTGDVLTGFIGALLARGLSAFLATALGAFVHGLLAEEWVKSGKDPECLMAQDLKDILPFVLQKLDHCQVKDKMDRM